MREVLSQQLWTGNAQEARDIQGLYELGISAVIDLAAEEPVITLPRELTYCRLPLIDGEENQLILLQTAIDVLVHFIQGDIATLVACSAGMSRSPAVAAGALSITNRISPEAALNTIAAKGPCDVAPGLWQQVLSLLKS